MYHITKEGTQLPIAGMDNNHLTNTIFLICNKIKPLTEEMVREAKELSSRGKALYGSNAISASRYRDIIESAHLQLGPYLLESTLRNINNVVHRGSCITAEVQAAFGRNDRDSEAPTHEQARLLRTQLEGYDEDPDEDDLFLDETPI